jgi:hypothetical protein
MLATPVLPFVPMATPAATSPVRLQGAVPAQPPALASVAAPLARSSARPLTAEAGTFAALQPMASSMPSAAFPGIARFATAPAKACGRGAHRAETMWRLFADEHAMQRLRSAALVRFRLHALQSHISPTIAALARIGDDAAIDALKHLDETVGSFLRRPLLGDPGLMLEQGLSLTDQLRQLLNGASARAADRGPERSAGSRPLLTSVRAK